MEYEVDGKEYRLTSGDSLLFDAPFPHSPPIENVAAGLVRIKADGYLGADRLTWLAEHDDIPDGFSLNDGNIVLAVDLAGNDGLTVPLVVADQMVPIYH